jgi:DNA-binding beta-propeller fold protein YncE
VIAVLHREVVDFALAVTRRQSSRAAVAFLLVSALAGEALFLERASAQTPAGVPRFEVDTSWPKLPNNWVLGLVSAIAVDRRDHVWILHRPRGAGVPADKRHLAAPPVLEFDAAGVFVRGWGGPADGYDWPDQEHGIFVDDTHVWIAGNAGLDSSVNKRSDDMLLKFTTAGRFVLQIGRRDSSGGNNDTKNLRSPSDVFVHRKTNEVFVADGYTNRRVVVFDAGTGAFKRMWGAFGNPPLDRTPAPPGAEAPPQPLDTEGPGPPQFGLPHAIEVSNDGLVYLADRPNRRIQVFTLDGKYVNQVFVNRAGPASGSACGMAFSPDPEQRFLYVADYGNSHIVIIDRKSLRVLHQFGARTARPGDFQGVHHLDVDSRGNLYTAEVAPGARAQRFVFKGVS